MSDYQLGPALKKNPNISNALSIYMGIHEYSDAFMIVTQKPNLKCFFLLQILREAQIQNKTEDRFPTEDGRKEENIKKNRYKDILPRKIIALF